MAKQSAGLIAYYFDNNKTLRVLLVHPGGPIFKKKDKGYWSIPKGEFNDEEDALTVAKREFWEETGNEVTATDFIYLTSVKLKSGKKISAWACCQYFETPFLQSNLFEMEWPPKSGVKKWFPETDAAKWFTVEEAKEHMYESQHPFLDALLTKLIF